MWYLQKCKSKPFISRSEHNNNKKEKKTEQEAAEGFSAA